MGTGKATRLSKVAREFNVGIATIVEFLHKKGFDIDSNPNTKVSPELYDILLKEYSSDINAKKESEKLSLNQLRSKKEAVSINDIDEENQDQEEETEEDDSFTSDEEILIKDVSSTQNSVTPKEEKSVSESKPQKQEESTKAESKEKKEPKIETTKKEEKSSGEEKNEQKESVKVIGKIDLDSLNQKTRPDKKQKKQKE
ncbi:MAG: translation initiation factor IF-2, partial [Bacteroidota bacterium]|nr:translation initiation factor IF-2 [Bacteroidota bacterium]